MTAGAALFPAPSSVPQLALVRRAREPAANFSVASRAASAAVEHLPDFFLAAGGCCSSQSQVLSDGIVAGSTGYLRAAQPWGAAVARLQSPYPGDDDHARRAGAAQLPPHVGEASNGQVLLQLLPLQLLRSLCCLVALQQVLDLHVETVQRGAFAAPPLRSRSSRARGRSMMIEGRHCAFTNSYKTSPQFCSQPILQRCPLLPYTPCPNWSE